MCPSAPRVCSEPGGQRPELSLSLDLIGPLETHFNEIFIEIHTFSFKKIHLKMSSGKWRPFCLGLNVLRQWLGTALLAPKLAFLSVVLIIVIETWKFY